MDRERQVELVLQRAAGDPDVLAVMLYGSAARGEAFAASDIDLCLVLLPARRTPAQMSAPRLEYLQEVDLDVQVFQQLPLYIRQRVLKDGRVLFVRDEDQLYEVAFRTVQAFEDFRSSQGRCSDSSNWQTSHPTEQRPPCRAAMRAALRRTAPTMRSVRGSATPRSTSMRPAYGSRTSATFPCRTAASRGCISDCSG
jgi:hypothetical protein